VSFKLAVRDARPSARQSTAPSILELPRAFAPDGGTGLVLHSSRLVLVDRQGRIRAHHRSDDLESLAKLEGNIRTLLGPS
jgi:hypothetical protein